MIIKYSDHAERKRLTRSIKEEDIERTIAKSDQRFVDVEHDAKVAIGPVGDRFLVVVYRTLNADIKVITVYHTRKLDKLLSSKTGRHAWRKIS